MSSKRDKVLSDLISFAFFYSFQTIHYDYGIIDDQQPDGSFLQLTAVDNLDLLFRSTTCTAKTFNFGDIVHARKDIRVMSIKDNFSSMTYTTTTTTYPSTTSPKTTCFPSNHGQGTVVMKNWEPLVLGPALAMDSWPGLVCLSWKFSSGNFWPRMVGLTFDYNNNSAKKMTTYHRWTVHRYR